MRSGWPAAALLLAAALGLAPGPATGQQAGSGAPPRQRPLVLQQPSLVVAPPPAPAPRLSAIPAPGNDCAPAWPCRLRLFGVIERNTGVGLKGPALTW